MSTHVVVIDGYTDFLLQHVDAAVEGFGGYVTTSGGFTPSYMHMMSTMRFSTAQEASQWARQRGWVVHEGIYDFRGNRQR